MWQPHTKVEMGREPGRSRADRLKLSARRGRFSPDVTSNPPDRKSGGLFLAGRAPIPRIWVHGLVVIVTFGLVGVAAPGFSAKKSAGKKAQHAGDTSTTTNQRSTASNPSSSRPDYKSGYKREGSEPESDTSRPPYKKIKPPTPPDDQRPLKKAKPPAKEPVRPVPKRVRDNPPPVVTPVIVPGGFPPLPAAYWYEAPEIIIATDDSYRDELSLEGLNLLLGAAVIVWNAAAVERGRTDEIAAGAGFFFGVTNLAASARSQARFRGLDAVVGVAAIAFSVWNVHGGARTPAGPYQNEIHYYANSSLPPPVTPTLGFSHSF